MRNTAPNRAWDEDDIESFLSGFGVLRKIAPPGGGRGICWVMRGGFRVILFDRNAVWHILFDGKGFPNNWDKSGKGIENLKISIKKLKKPS